MHFCSSDGRLCPYKYLKNHFFEDMEVINIINLRRGKYIKTNDARYALNAWLGSVSGNFIFILVIDGLNVCYILCRKQDTLSHVV